MTRKKIFIITLFVVSIPQMVLSLDDKYKVDDDKYAGKGYRYEKRKKIALSDYTKPWKGEGEFGFYQMIGNIDHQNLLGRLGITYTTKSWIHHFKFNSVRTKTNGNLDAEAYILRFQNNYKLSEERYWFTRFKYENDTITHFKYQTSISTGYGFTVFNTKTNGLNLDAGVGFRRNKIKDNKEITEELVGVGQISYFRKIGSHTKFTQDFIIDAGSEDIYTESLTGLKVNIIDAIAMKLSYLIKNHSANSNQENTDTISAVTLVYDF